MNNQQSQFLILGVGIFTAIIPLYWLAPGWPGMVAGAWVILVGIVSFLSIRRFAAPIHLPGFIASLISENTVRLDRRVEEQDPASQALNRLLTLADQQLTGIAASSSRLVPISRELSDGYMMIHQKSQMQNQYGNLVASSVRELEEMRVQVHQQNHEISEAVDGAVQGTEQSLDTVRIATTGMQALAESTEQAAQQIDVLANVNTEILSIAKTITEIAESTNLLALNAAIEAARAGEHGRGFAVVADEVRRLSAQTQAATANIRDLADSVGADSERTISQIRNTRDSAITTRDAMEKATGEITDIASAVNRIKHLSDQITEAMQQQQQVAVSAGDSVASLVELNGSVVADNQTHHVSEGDLIKLSDTLHARIDKFVLSEDGWDESMRPKRVEQRQPAHPVGTGQPQAAEQGEVELF